MSINNIKIEDEFIEETQAATEKDKLNFDNSEMQNLQKEKIKNSRNNLKERETYEGLSDEQIKRMIENYDPPTIKDFPKIPYKSIFIIIFLFISSLIFLYNGYISFIKGQKWSKWLGYVCLGILLFIPGGFYGYYLINILLGRRGYSYEDIPVLNDDN